MIYTHDSCFHPDSHAMCASVPVKFKRGPGQPPGTNIIFLFVEGTTNLRRDSNFR